MKAQIRVSPKVIIEIEASKQKDLFKAIASAHEVFGETHCGLCGSDKIVPIWRTVSKVTGKKVETFEFPEYHCRGRTKDGSWCGGRLSLGTINDDSGTLYPQRRLLPNGKPPGKNDKEAASYGSHNGWTRWKGKGDETQDGGDE